MNGFNNLELGYVVAVVVVAVATDCDCGLTQQKIE